nr:unnamed protein product [Spirometra erinaceieuropaei]
MLEASQSNGISTFHKCSLFNLFEVLFNRKSEHCHKLRIKNPDSVKKKLTRMIALGKDNLQVISDFDWTLSKFVHKGSRYDPGNSEQVTYFATDLSSG